MQITQHRVAIAAYFITTNSSIMGLKVWVKIAIFQQAVANNVISLRT